MQTEKAKALNEFIFKAIDTYETVKVGGPDSKSISNEIKVQFHDVKFEKYFEAFLDELKANVRDCQDIDLLYDYMVICLTEEKRWMGFEIGEKQRIISNKYEARFLMNFKETIENYIDKLHKFCSKDNFNNAISLRSIYEDEMRAILNNMLVEEAGNIIENTSIVPIKDDRFDFNKLKSECSQLTKMSDKLALIEERLADLEQWELQNDEEIDEPDFGLYYHYSTRYYPNFRKLCEIEMNKIKRIDNIQKHSSNHKILEILPNTTQNHKHYDYKWNATETDLLELVTALFKKEAFVRRDGKAIKRIELINYFQELLGLEIKDVEGKLTRATGRNDNTAFLDGLTAAFKNYKVEKELRKKQLKP
ncbi:MAG: RteC domain-containing protein [Paludibacter sp.]